MDDMANIALSHNITYPASQAMLYLVACSWRIQRLDELERYKARFVAHESGYKLQIANFEKEICSCDHKHDLLAAAKAYVEEVQALLETKVDSLVHSNKG